MAEDLYTLWLGVSACPRPPDHYALLGVPKFCDDLPLIEKAARGQLRQLDKYAIHPDRAKRAACAAMMNEVAEAHVALVHAERKRAYDASLGRQFPAGPTATRGAAGALPVPDVAQPPQAMPARPAQPAADAKTEFQEEVRRHLHQWMLNDHEMRLLLATADSLGIDANVARQMIQRIDAEADQAAQQASRRWIRFLVGAAGAAVLIVLAAVFLPGWLRSPADHSRSASDGPSVGVGGRETGDPPGKAVAVVAAQARIRQALADGKYGQVPKLLEQLRALEAPADLEGLVLASVNELRPKLARRLADGQWNAAAETAKVLFALRPKDSATSKLIGTKTASLVDSALAASDEAAAKGYVAAALILSPTDSGALSASGTVARKFHEIVAPVQPAQNVSSTSRPVGRPVPGDSVPPKDLTLGLGGKVSMKLVLIPAGKFMMGSPDTERGRRPFEGPQREVTITKPFYMGQTEVTQAQYEAVVGKNLCAFEGPQNPVEQVSWNDAVQFCRKLSQKPGGKVRLPTEAEWEYACRAGTKTTFSFADHGAALGDYAWGKANSDGRTHPVGQKKPNAWGLYDMHGNVAEWCSDCFADSYTDAKNEDPQGPAFGSNRALRGGSCNAGWAGCRSAARGQRGTARRFNDIGFRVVLEVN